MSYGCHSKPSAIELPPIQEKYFDEATDAPPTKVPYAWILRSRRLDRELRKVAP